MFKKHPSHYCCITNNTKFSNIEIKTILLDSKILGIKNSERAKQ